MTDHASVPASTGDKVSIESLAIDFYENVDFHPTRTADEDFDILGEYAPCRAPKGSKKNPYSRETWVYVFRVSATGFTTLRAEIQYDEEGTSKMVDWRKMNRWIRDGKPEGGGPSWKGKDTRPANVERETFVFPWDRSEGDPGWTYYAMLSSVQLSWARIEEYRQNARLLQMRARALTEEADELQMPSTNGEPAAALLTDWLRRADYLHRRYQRAVEAKRAYEARYAPEHMHYTLTRMARQSYERQHGEPPGTLQERLDAFSTVDPTESEDQEPGSGVYDVDRRLLQQEIERRGKHLYETLNTDPYHLARRDAVAMGVPPSQYNGAQAEWVAEECVRQGTLLSDAEECDRGRQYLKSHFGINFDSNDNWYKKYAFEQKVLKQMLSAGEKGLESVLENMETEHSGSLSKSQQQAGRALLAKVNYAKALQVGVEEIGGPEVSPPARQLTTLLEGLASSTSGGDASVNTGTRLVGPNADVAIPSTGSSSMLTAGDLFGGPGTSSRGGNGSSIEKPPAPATTQTADGLRVLPVENPTTDSVTRLQFERRESGIYTAKNGGLMARAAPEGWTPSRIASEGRLTNLQKNVLRRQQLVQDLLKRTDVYRAMEGGGLDGGVSQGGGATSPSAGKFTTALGLFGRALAGLDALSVWTGTAAFHARIEKGRPDDMSRIEYAFYLSGDAAGVGAGASGVVSGLNYSQAVSKFVTQRLGMNAAFRVAGATAAALGAFAAIADFVEAWQKGSEMGMLSASVSFLSAVVVAYAAYASLIGLGLIGIGIALLALFLSLMKDSELEEWFEDCYWNQSEGPFSRTTISDIDAFITSVAEGSWPEADTYEVPNNRLSKEIDDLLTIASRPTVEAGFWDREGRSLYEGRKNSSFENGIPTWLRIRVRPGLMPKGSRLELTSLEVTYDEWGWTDPTIVEISGPINLKTDARVVTVQSKEGLTEYLLHVDVREALSEEQKTSFAEKDPLWFQVQAELSVEVEGEKARGLTQQIDQTYRAEWGITHERDIGRGPGGATTREGDITVNRYYRE